MIVIAPALQPQPRFAILKSFWRTVRYSLGSVAFGALLIAVRRHAC